MMLPSVINFSKWLLVNTILAYFVVPHCSTENLVVSHECFFKIETSRGIRMCVRVPVCLHKSYSNPISLFTHQRQSFEQSACHISHFTSKSLYSWQLLHLSIVPLRHEYCKHCSYPLILSTSFSTVYNRFTIHAPFSFLLGFTLASVFLPSPLTPSWLTFLFFRLFIDSAKVWWRCIHSDGESGVSVH